MVDDATRRAIIEKTLNNRAELEPEAIETTSNAEKGSPKGLLEQVLANKSKEDEFEEVDNSALREKVSQNINMNLIKGILG